MKITFQNWLTDCNCQECVTHEMRDVEHALNDYMDDIDYLDNLWELRYQLLAMYRKLA